MSSCQSDNTHTALKPQPNCHYINHSLNTKYNTKDYTEDNTADNTKDNTKYDNKYEYNKMIIEKNINLDKIDFAMLMMSMASNMQSPLKRAANLN